MWRGEPQGKANGNTDRHGDEQAAPRGEPPNEVGEAPWSQEAPTAKGTLCELLFRAEDDIGGGLVHGK